VSQPWVNLQGLVAARDRLEQAFPQIRIGEPVIGAQQHEQRRVDLGAVLQQEPLRF
jgi:hypothetical protein